MKRLLPALLCWCLLVPTAYAGGTGSVTQVGLEGFARANELTRVRVTIVNPAATPQKLQLTLKVGPKDKQAFLRTDVYTKELAMTAGQTVEFDLPVVLNFENDSLLSLEVRDAGGHLVGADERIVSPQRGRVVTILCAESATCQKVEAAVRSGYGAIAQDKNSETITYVQSAELPEVWWAYTATTEEVVVARSLIDATPPQRDALEEFARQGGRVLILNREANVGDWLSEYVDAPGVKGLQPHIVGTGRMIRVASADDPLISAVPIAPDDYVRIKYARYGGDPLSGALHVLATTFRFPSILWLLAWLVVYVVVVGVVNFAVLRKLKRLELGWITIPAIALLFAVLLFVSSDASRPRHVALDEVVLYNMDANSAKADVSIGLRVSSPGRRDIRLQGPPNSVFIANTTIPSVMSVWRDLSSESGDIPGWTMELGPPAQTDLSLLRWSFQDIEFHSSARLAGTVRRIGPRRFRNETGMDLKSALFITGDVMHGIAYRLGHVAPGAEIDLDQLKREPRRNLYGQEEHDLLVLTVRDRPTISPGGEFFGLTENVDAGAKVAGGDYVHNGFGMIDVAYEGKP